LLSLTDNAAEAVRHLAAVSGLEPEPGVRISPGQPTETGTPLEISLAAGPEASDQTVEEGGATVYVEDDVAEFLDDKVLDATVDAGQVRFRIQDAGEGEGEG
jgi:Fe-S cluster assembly iron-binding protein IscA